MNTVAVPASKYSRAPITTLVAWTAVLIVSILPDVLWLELTGSIPAWLYPFRVGCAAVFLTATLIWSTFKPLRAFALVLLAVLSLDWGVHQLFEIWHWEARLVGQILFARNMLAVQGPRFILALLMTGLLWLLMGNRHNFFSGEGESDRGRGSHPADCRQTDFLAHFRPYPLSRANERTCLVYDHLR